MWLGKNPGGDPRVGDLHPHETPFTERRGWSAYMDLKWGNHTIGGHPMQRAVLDAASLFAGDGHGGEALIRNSPAGNLSPFRSRSWMALPRELRDITVGVDLIRLARPRTLVLLFSESNLWSRLMDALGRQTPTRQIIVSDGAGYTFRESVDRDGSPEYIFALPGVNTSTAGHNDRVLTVLSERIVEHNL